MGKTSLSIEIAKRYNCEIISVDSMQVYKGMDIGTAKVRPDEMAGIKHHLIDIIEPDQQYNAGKFVQDASKIIASVTAKGRAVLLTGGTGLYYKSLLFGLSEDLPSFPLIRRYLVMKFIVNGKNADLHDILSTHDPESGKRIHPNDSQRLVRALEIFLGTGIPMSQLLEKDQQQKKLKFPNSALICLERERQELYARIDLRCKLMLDEGLEHEVRGLIAKGYNLHNNSMRSIGYKQMVEYLNGQYSWEEMLDTMRRDTRRYAKRQLTWFRGMDNFSWISPESKSEIFKYIENNVDFS